MLSAETGLTAAFGLAAGRSGHCHRAFRIEQVIVAGAESEFDQRARIRNLLRLPPLICLIALHRRLRGVIPRSRRLALHVVLADERCLNLPGATRVNRLLAPLLRTVFGALLAVGASAPLSYGVR